MSCEVSSIDYVIQVSTINTDVHSSMKWLNKPPFAILSVLVITLVLAYSITDSYQDEHTLPIKEEACFPS